MTLNLYYISTINLKLRFMVLDVQTTGVWNNASKCTDGLSCMYAVCSALITNLF